MPKEKVRGDNPGNQPFEVVVGWQKDIDMQVGIQVADPQTSDSPSTLIEVLYPATETGTLTAAGARLREELGLSDFGGSDYQIGLIAVRALSGSYPFPGVWWTPTRYGVNQLIRLLRKARDQAYGADA